MARANRTFRHSAGRVAPLVGIAVLSVAAIVACRDEDDPAADEDGEAESSQPGELPRLHAERGDRPGIYDEDGRQIVLRGMNLNSLAEYAQNNADYEPTVPLTGDTWDEIAAEGFNSVRLLVSWSRLEPEPGEIDESYIDEIRQAIRDAADRQLYTIVDMHQDAWGPHVASPPGTQCPAGKEPSNGWDGAPEWATPSPAEFDSCRGVDGEAKPGSPLVAEAWHRFYTDADDVQTHLVDVWAELATALADQPSVAGYDLLNEPGHGRDQTAPAGLITDFAPLGDFYARAIDSIRQAETDAGIEPRPIFFEPTVIGNPPPADFSDDPGLVYAPHVYGGSITDLVNVEQHWDLVWSQATAFETSLWVGEYGWFDDPADHPEYVERLQQFALREDGGSAAFVPAGSAWWQWTTGCGDPHRITSADLEPEGESWQYRLAVCPSGEDKGVVPEWRRVLTRPYPRFAPGWLTSLQSASSSAGSGEEANDNSDARRLVVEGSDAEPGSSLELWVPGEAEPAVEGEGVSDPSATQTGRGWIVTAEVTDAAYSVTVR